MNKTHKLIIGIIAVIIIAWVGFSLSTKQNESVEPQPKAVLGDTIKIGFIGPLSGDAAVYGEPLQKVLQLAVDEINAAGGINGTTQIEMIYEDGGCNGKDASNAMQKLVNVDKVKIVIGGFCSSESLAAVPIATQNKVILFSAGSSSPDLTGASPYFFRNYPSDASQGKVLAKMANSNDWSSVAVIQEQLDYPLGIKNAFTDAFEEIGGLVTLETFASDVKDFRTILTKLRSTNPDALLVSIQTPAAAERILQQVKELQWDVNLMGADVIPGSNIPSTKPNLVEGMIVAEFGYDATSPKYQAFENAYMEKYGTEVEFKSYAQTEYDSIYLLADALSAVGEDPDAIANWLRDLDGWDGISGTTAFSDTGDRSEGGHRPEVIENGEVKMLEL